MLLKRIVSPGVWALWLTVAFLALVAVAGATDGTAEREFDATPLLTQAQAQGSVRVVVGLRVPGAPLAQHPEGQWPDADTVARQRAAVAQAQDGLLARLPTSGVQRVYRLQNIPWLVLEVDADALAALAAAPEVVSLSADELQPPALDDSVPLIGGNGAWQMGYTGRDWAVAIVDTGVDGNHPFLQGKVVAEACFSSENASAHPLCPNGETMQTGPGAAVPCPAGVDGCLHGTHVAGIAAGRQPANDPTAPPGGVAPDAYIVAVQVFSRFDDAENCKSRPSPCALSYGGDQLRALDHLYTLATQVRLPIAAANLSIGSGNYETTCDAARPGQAEAVARLRALGIATIASAGNNGYANAVGIPACLSGVISVAASTMADTVATFSNNAPFVSLLAPGTDVRSSVPGGGYDTWQGTSMAAPHVAGAWAVLKQAKPGATVSELLSALTQTGKLVADPRSSVVKPRLQLDAALVLLSATATPTPTPSATPTPSPTPTAPATLPVEVIAVTVAQGDQVNPAAEFSPPRNEFLIAWADARDSSSGWRLYGQRLTTNAEPRGSNFLIADVGTPLNREAPYPRVVWNSQQREYFVAWRSADVGGVVYGQRLNALGERIGNRLTLSPTDVDTAYNHQRLALAYNPLDDEYLLGWTDERLAASGRVMLQRLTAQGAPVGGLTPVCPVCGGISQRNPTAIYNPTAREYFMAWQELVGASIDIIGQRVTRSATTLTPGIVIAAAEGTQNLPAVTWDPMANRYMVVWRDARLDPASTARRSVWGRLVGADGTVLSPERPLTALFSDQRNPAVAWHGGDSEGYLAMWADARAYGGTESAANTDLLARWLDTQGQPDPTTPGDMLVSRDRQANNPALVYAGTWARLLLVWQDTRFAAGSPTPMGFDIVAAVYATGPIPTPTPTVTPTPTPTLTPTPTATPVSTGPAAGVVVLQQGRDGYAGARDTYLDRYNANVPLGSRLNLYFYINDGDGQARSILLDFDLAAVQLPPASEIVAAYLSLYQHTWDGAGSLVIRAYDLNRPWDEAQATWLQPRADALWNIPGANGVPDDRKGRGSQPVVLSADAGNGWKQWNVTEMVRWWLGNPAAHFGLKLQAAGEARGETFAWFYAKEDWEHTDLRPKLEIHYAHGNPNVTPTPPPNDPPILMRQMIAPAVVNGG